MYKRKIEYENVPNKEQKFVNYSISKCESKTDSIKIRDRMIYEIKQNINIRDEVIKRIEKLNKDVEELKSKIFFQSRNELLLLPDELWDYIFNYNNITDYKLLRLTCPKFNNTIGYKITKIFAKYDLKTIKIKEAFPCVNYLRLENYEKSINFDGLINTITLNYYNFNKIEKVFNENIKCNILIIRPNKIYIPFSIMNTLLHCLQPSMLCINDIIFDGRPVIIDCPSNIYYRMNGYQLKDGIIIGFRNINILKVALRHIFSYKTSRKITVVSNIVMEFIEIINIDYILYHLDEFCVDEHTYGFFFNNIEDIKKYPKVRLIKHDDLICKKEFNY